MHPREARLLPTDTRRGRCRARVRLPLSPEQQSSRVSVNALSRALGVRRGGAAAVLGDGPPAGSRQPVRQAGLLRSVQASAGLAYDAYDGDGRLRAHLPPQRRRAGGRVAGVRQRALPVRSPAQRDGQLVLRRPERRRSGLADHARRHRAAPGRCCPPSRARLQCRSGSTAAFGPSKSPPAGADSLRGARLSRWRSPLGNDLT